MLHELTEPTPIQYYTPPLKGVSRYLDRKGVRTLASRCCRVLITAMWCVVVALPLALLSVLLALGMTCIICNRHIWPWQRSTDARYTDNMDIIHEGCCPQLARDLN